MISPEKKIEDFIALGDYMRNFSIQSKSQELFSQTFEKLICTLHQENAWFTESNVRKSISEHGNWLRQETLSKWLQPYKINTQNTPKKIGVIMAGNIPLVGFHDFISVIFSGNIFLGKMSSKDNKILQHLAEFLINRNPKYKDLIKFESNQLKDFDAIIATGSNNTSRYFDYYFGKYPNIIRKNRNSVAILTGNETSEQIKELGHDIFDYFGLGCRNVSKIFTPENFDLENFFENLNEFSEIYQHNKYANNYDYNKSIYLMNQIQHFDNGFVLLKEDNSLNSPIGVIHYETYKNLNDVKKNIDLNRDLIQCIIGDHAISNEEIAFGDAQKPALWDYADNIDTLDFLLNLH